MILFSCNAGPDVGFGHLTRCRALAKELSERGETSVMVGPAMEYSNASDKQVFSDWVPCGEWQSSTEAATRLLCLAKDFAAQSAVLDDYRIDEPYQIVLKDHGLRWLQFDGTAQKPLWANWILNSSPTARSEDYQLVKRHQGAKLLLGPGYAILRNRFREIGTRSCSRPLHRVLVTFGGGDDRGAIEFVLSSLVEHVGPNIEFLVVSGKTNPRNASLSAWINSIGSRVTLEIDPTDVAQVFADCDLAIMGAGSSIYEAACCGVPMILVAIADNQIKHGAAWEKMGAAMFLGELGNITPTSLQSAFRQLSESSLRRAEYCKVAQSFCDGLGAQRVAAAILS